MEVLDEVVQKTATKWDLYNRIDALLPLFGLTEIPLFMPDGRPKTEWVVINGEEVEVQQKRPINLIPRDFLIMRCIAKNENADALELIADGDLKEDDPAAITAWTWISEKTIAHDCGISRSTVARTMESCGPVKVADVSPRRKVGTEQRSVGQGFIDIQERGRDSEGHQLSEYRRINRQFLADMEAYLPHYLKATKSSPDLEEHKEHKAKIQFLLAKKANR
jgi:hypothetical protein